MPSSPSLPNPSPPSAATATPRQPKSAVQLRRALRASKRAAERQSAFTKAHVLLGLFFAWLLVLHCVGIWFFTRGFLLTRLVLERESECSVSPEGIVDGSAGGESGCWHGKKFEKAVVVVIDALRYDFTVPQDTGALEEGVGGGRKYHNAFEVLYRTAVEAPEHAVLLPFISDPPTTTLQRLKGLMTGTLPTFIDAGSNFAGTAIEEDNLVAQLTKAGKTMVHLGDDTWHSLFPGSFDPEMTRAYDSFNVWDLHTVDDGVIEHIFPLLREERYRGKWDVMFAHLLGVDHAGHRYGPDHDAMTAKLKQMDQMMKNIIDSIDEETLLVVLGDHGMDSKGDHGGESDDEVEAALWMYSKKPFFGRTIPENRIPPQTAKERRVPQIDLVPTLSLLLGLPIPFNNLGSPIEEAFIGKAGNDWKNLAEVNRLTAAQIKRYQDEYALAKGVESQSSEALAAFVLAEEKYRGLMQIKKPTVDQFREVAGLLKIYQRETLAVCRALWAEFDVGSMIMGIGLLGAGVVVLVVYARGLSGERMSVTPGLMIAVGAGMGLGAAIGTAVGPVALSLTAFEGAAFVSNVGGIVGAVTALATMRQKLVSVLPDSLWGWLAFIVTIAQAIGFASNSYTIWEDELLLFFLSTFGVLAACSSMRQRNTSDRVLGVYHSLLFVFLTRLASLSRLCREEQMPYCRSTFYASATSSTSAPWQLLIPFVVALLLPSIIKGYYKGTLSYYGSAVFWIGFALRMGLLLVAIYWAVDTADDGEWTSLSKEILKDARVLIAQFVLFIAGGVGGLTFGWAKPCVSVGVSGEESQSQPQQSNGANSPTKEQPPTTKPTVSILGYANTYGSHFFLLPTILLLGLILVQKPMGTGSLAILCWQILSLGEILDTNNLNSDPVSAIGPIVLAMLGSFHFFKTGHQATLSSIQWDAAFVPLRGIVYPWSPIFVLMNTFGAQILAAVAVPILVLWKRSVAASANDDPSTPGPTTRANIMSQSSPSSSTTSLDKTLQIPSTPSKHHHSTHSKPSTTHTPILTSISTALSTHILYYATLNLATTVWAMWLRRHLMLYRIFSPRFMMGGLVLVVVEVVSLVIGLGGMGVSVSSVGGVFGW